MSDCLLSLGFADEVVVLDNAILVTISAMPTQDVFRFLRLSRHCGQYMMHSGRNPDWVARLFRHGTVRFGNDLVHERLLTTGPVARLKSALLHLSFPNFEAVLDKVNRYSTPGARGMAMNGKSATSEADYFVFMDGDCIPNPRFVAAHAALSEPGFS